MLTQAIPHRSCLVAADLCRRSANRRVGAREPHIELAVMPDGSRNRERLSGPAVHCLESALFWHLELECDFGRGLREDLDRRLGDESERSQRAGGKPRNVVAGYVLHHATAKLERTAAAIDELYAEHK